MSNSKFAQKRAICESKIRYENTIAAEYVIQKNHRDLCQDYYGCEVCGGYHIYTTNKKVSRKRAQRDESKHFKKFNNLRKNGRKRRKGKR
jgi:membrane carboxypeptidase/penicillin-binding protein